MKDFNKTKTPIISKIFVNGTLLTYSLFCLVPIILVLSISLTGEESLILEGYHLLPKDFSLSAYYYVFNGTTSIIRAFMVSTIVTVSGTIIHLIITSMLAYVVSRKEVKYRNIISFYVYFTILFNGGLVPYYIMVTKYLHLKNTIFILIMIFVVSAMNVLIMKNFFKAIPESLIESARIEGSGEFNTFVKIVIPLSKPSLAAIGLFTAVAYWNDWFTCSLFIEDASLYNLQYLLHSLMTNISYLQNNSMASKGMEKMIGMLPSESARMATCILAIVPITILYPFLQKHFVKGLTLGAVKE